MTKDQVRQQFGANAAAYVSSPTHAQGASLARLVELADPQPAWRVLDVATAAGHTALAFAPRVSAVIGLDLTPEMLPLAARLAAERGAANVAFAVGDVDDLPFGGAFDLVTCRIAPHHFADIGRFLAEAARALRPGGRLVVELLDPARIDRKDSTWWFADDKGLWGERPFLHLGERRWDAAERASVERFTTLDLATGALDEIVLCDQSYEVEEMTALLRAAGFGGVAVYPGWDGLALYDAGEWIVYVATH